MLNKWDTDDDNDGKLLGPSSHITKASPRADRCHGAFSIAGILDEQDEDANGDGQLDCQPIDSDGDGIPDHLVGYLKFVIWPCESYSF